MGDSGRTVRCSRCNHSWHQNPESAEISETLSEIAQAVAASAAREQAAQDTDSAGSESKSLDMGGLAEAIDAKIAGRDSAPPDLLATDEAAAEDHKDSEPQPQSKEADIAKGLESPPPEPAKPAPSDETTLRASKAAKVAPASDSGKSNRFLVAVALLFVVLGVLVVGRSWIVREFPAAAAIYNAVGLPDTPGAGLLVKDVISEVVSSEGGRQLVIKGLIVNEGADSQAVPILQFRLIDAAGEEVEAWQLDLETDALAVGDWVLFETTVANPPDQAKVSLEFAK